MGEIPALIKCIFQESVYSRIETNKYNRKKSDSTKCKAETKKKVIQIEPFGSWLRLGGSESLRSSHLS